MKTFVKLLTVLLLSFGGNTAFALLGDPIPVVEDMPTEEIAGVPQQIVSSGIKAQFRIGFWRGILWSGAAGRPEYGKVTYTAYGLPEGLVMEPSSGFIYGTTYVPSGTYYFSVRLTNSKGSCLLRKEDKAYAIIVTETSVNNFPILPWDKTPIGYVGDTFLVDIPDAVTYDYVSIGWNSNISGAALVLGLDLSTLTVTLADPGVSSDGISFNTRINGGGYTNCVYGSSILCLPEGYDENLVQYDETTGNVVDSNGNILVYGTPEDNDDGDTGTTVVVSDETPVMAFSATREVTTDNEEVVADLEVTAPAVATPTVADVLRGKTTQFNYDLYVMLEIGDGVLFITDTGEDQELTESAKEFTKRIKSGKHRIFDLKMTPVLRLALRGVKIKWYAGCVSDEMEVCGGIATATTEFK